MTEPDSAVETAIVSPVLARELREEVERYEAAWAKMRSCLMATRHVDVVAEMMNRIEAKYGIGGHGKNRPSLD